jgi:hypothetical protein
MSDKQRFAITRADFLEFRKMKSLPKEVREKIDQLWSVCDYAIGCHDPDDLNAFRDSEDPGFFDSTLHLREVSVASNGSVHLQLVQSIDFSVPLAECHFVSDEDRKALKKCVKTIGRYGETILREKLKRYEALSRK